MMMSEIYLQKVYDNGFNYYWVFKEDPVLNSNRNSAPYKTKLHEICFEAIDKDMSFC